MFFKRHKEKAIGDLSILKTDMHSHLIPGIDDGSPDIDMSLRLIRGMKKLGYSKLITTPHITWDMFKNTRETILGGLDKLRTAIEQEGLQIEVRAAAEYFLDDHVTELLKNNEPLLTLSGNMVLVEFSMAFPSFSAKGLLFDLQMKGYQPVLAHPERYQYLENNKEFFDELKTLGCLFQLNLLSLTNYYGRSVHALAQYLIKKGYYNLAGTDLHHLQHLNRLSDPGLEAELKKVLDSCKLINSQL